jgi:hypothetical protein
MSSTLLLPDTNALLATVPNGREAVEDRNSGSIIVANQKYELHRHLPLYLEQKKTREEASTMTIEIPASLPIATSNLMEKSFSLGNDPTAIWSDSLSSASGSSCDLDAIESVVATQQQRPTFRRLHERSDSGQIRSKLLLKLGIEKGYTGSSGLSSEPSRVVQQGQESAFNVALKGDYGRPDQSLERSKHPIESLAVLGTKMYYKRIPSGEISVLMPVLKFILYQPGRTTPNVCDLSCGYHRWKFSKMLQGTVWNLLLKIGMSLRLWMMRI